MIRIAVLGDRNPAYLTHRELDAALELFPSGVEARWLPTTDPAVGRIESYDAVWVVPGTPYQDDDAVLAAICTAREADLPILGTCGGFQYMVLEFARNVAGLPDAAHAELEPDATDPVLARLACSLVGERRTVTPIPGTRLAGLCGTQPFSGFHWCNFGLSPERESRLEQSGLVVSARAPDAGVEAVELPGRRFYLATLFQPQMGSSESRMLHPILSALAAAAGSAAPVVGRG